MIVTDATARQPSSIIPIHSMKSINEVIETGIVFRPASKPKEDDGKVKTKAKKKKYITGAHGSGSAKQKAKYRQRRANRHKK